MSQEGHDLLKNDVTHDLYITHGNTKEDTAMKSWNNRFHLLSGMLINELSPLALVSHQELFLVHAICTDFHHTEPLPSHVSEKYSGLL
jgi:hypothetical protein